MEAHSLEANPKDVNTFSNFTSLLQKHMYIEVTLDLDKKELVGSVETDYTILDANVDKLILDLKGPEVLKIEQTLPDQTKQEVKYETDSNNPDKQALGTPLIIHIIKPKINEKMVNIKIYFKSNETSSALQFLSREQTHTKNYPFMFSQCEPTLCRTIFPCQDTPAAKVTINALCKVKRPLTFLFSGLLTSKKEKGEYNIFQYSQPIPITTYLISFAAGELAYEKVSKRCGVWAEKGLEKISKNEFIDMEKYIETLEAYLNYPYVWTKYDVLVLPFSFPYGGMENPNMTFVTPTLLAGDRSLANVVAHEISHSWTGNLVTNKNWMNFWLNEGFTVFLERKVSEIITGSKDLANLDALGGLHALEFDIKLFGEDSTFTCLQPDYSHVDPDDGFSRVPYEKGFNFLKYLENIVGEEHFKNILRIYIKKYEYKSIEFQDFKDTFLEYALKNLDKSTIEKIEWDEWVYGKGMPKIKNDFPTKYLEEIDSVITYIKGKNYNNDLRIRGKFEEWHTNVKLLLLDKMIEDYKNYDDALYNKVKTLFDMAEKYNTEVRCKWYKFSMLTGHRDEIENVKKFLVEMGRMKFLKPLYLQWYELDKSECKSFFNMNKNLYHSFAKRILENKLK